MHLNTLLEGYLSGVSTLATFLTLPEEIQYRRPQPQSWSAGEVIHHLADTDLAWAQVYRRLLVEHQPTIPLWNAEAYADGLYYAQRPLLHAVSTITAVRHANVDLFAAVKPQQWRRTAIHHEQGPMTLKELVLLATTEFEEGLAQARRAVNGSP